MVYTKGDRKPISSLYIGSEKPKNGRILYLLFPVHLGFLKSLELAFLEEKLIAIKNETQLGARTVECICPPIPCISYKHSQPIEGFMNATSNTKKFQYQIRFTNA